MTPELCKNSIRTREEEITGDHQRTATADYLLSITPPRVVAPGMYGKTSHVTRDDRSQVHNDEQRSAHCSDSAAAVLPLVSYPQMVTNIRSNPWRDSWNRLGSWVLES